MAKIIIFGIEDFAELAHYYLENDSNHEVVAFSVYEKYLPENKNDLLTLFNFDDEINNEVIDFISKNTKDFTDPEYMLTQSKYLKKEI